MILYLHWLMVYLDLKEKEEIKNKLPYILLRNKSNEAGFKHDLCLKPFFLRGTLIKCFPQIHAERSKEMLI